MEFDVVVAGSGAGALTAATVAAQSGLKVLVCEKTDLFGGTTALSMGGAWIIANKHQAALGIADSRQAGEIYLRHVLGDRYEHEKINSYLEFGAEMVSYMEDRTAMRWTGMLMPDYYPASPGACVGRAVLTRDFDGRALGPYLRHMRMPLRGFVLFGSLQIAMLEAGKFHSVLRDLPSFFHVARRVLCFGRDLLLHQRGTRLTNGGALVGRLLRSALDAGVELRRNAPVTGLVVEGGRVRAAIVGRGKDRTEIGVRRGVVLATGGFGASEKLRAMYLPLPEAHLSAQPESDCGDGIELGLAAGGALATGNSDNGLWAPVSILRHTDGRVDKFPHFGLDRGKPGSIIVGPDGKRFADEAASYQEFVRVMHRRKMSVAYFIASRAFQRHYGMGLALPSPYPISELIRKGYLIRADSLEKLAEGLSIPGDALRTTVTEFDRHAAAGTDPEFGRGSNAYDHSQGDSTHQPNCNLAPVGAGPYVAVKLHPGSASTFLGLNTDERARVLNGNGEPIQGLFAVGLDQNSIFRGDYPGGGSGLGPAMTFGYVAGKTLAAA